MMKKISAGLLMYRWRNGGLEFFLAHPGGPYLKNKDWGYWGIPKGEIEADEEYLDAACREFFEETGIKPAGEFLPLGSVTLVSGKTVHAWAFAGDLVAGQPLVSNQFSLEWPPHSGREQSFPEIDKADFFPAQVARRKITPAQTPFLDRLEEILADRNRSRP